MNTTAVLVHLSVKNPPEEVAVVAPISTNLGRFHPNCLIKLANADTYRITSTGYWIKLLPKS